jgi:hypothetical protein
MPHLSHTSLVFSYFQRCLFIIIGNLPLNLGEKPAPPRLIMAAARLQTVQASSSHEAISNTISEETKRLR